MSLTVYIPNDSRSTFLHSVHLLVLCLHFVTVSAVYSLTKVGSVIFLFDHCKVVDGFLFKRCYFLKTPPPPAQSQPQLRARIHVTLVDKENYISENIQLNST